MLVADGFDDAFIGIARIFNSPPIACYDTEKCLQVLMKRDRMTYEEAQEFFEFNVIGAYVGEQTPVFVVVGNLKDAVEGLEDI